MATKPTRVPDPAAPELAPPDSGGAPDPRARFLPGLETEREETPVVRGPDNPDGRGRVVLEDEDVAEREADADATDEDVDPVVGDDA